MTKEELKQYLIDESEYSEREVDGMTDLEMVDAYLTWNGIIGYTSDIIEAVFAAYGIKERI